MIQPLLAMPQGAEWLVILLIVIIVFGAAKLPDLARSTGQALKIFKNETKGLIDSDEDKDAKAPRAPRRPRPPTRRPRPRRRLGSCPRSRTVPRPAPRPDQHRGLDRAPPGLSRDPSCLLALASKPRTRVDHRRRVTVPRQARPPGRRRRTDGALGPPARAARPDPQGRADPAGRSDHLAGLLPAGLRLRLRPLPRGAGHPARRRDDRHDERSRGRAPALPQALRLLLDRGHRPCGSTRSGPSSCPACTPRSASGAASSPRSPVRCSSAGSRWATSP